MAKQTAAPQQRIKKTQPDRSSPIQQVPLGSLVFHEVDQSRLKDLIALFEDRGGPKSCWCMVWRATPQEAKQTAGASRKAAFTKRVKQGVPVGILGYLADKPIAWCSIAPRSTYRSLGGPVEEPEEVIWSLVCFFVPRQYRGQGLTARLITAAVGHARQGGATVVEAYPVPPTSPSYRFMGFIPVFKKAGFVEVGRAGTRRHVLRLELKHVNELQG